MTMMIDNTQKNSFYNIPATPKQVSGLILPLFFISAVAFAAANGIAQLPESYRTPLSDMVYENNKEWRAEDAEKNPWREDEEELILKPRLKAEFFPQYNYEQADSMRNQYPRSLFQNENDIVRPPPNIFKYTF